MSNWKIYTADGVQDILFEDCYLKRGLEQKFRSLFTSCGFREVESPTMEFYDVFASDEAAMPQENMYKFFDQQGRILVLRPDITIPVARITATKYREARYPLRVSYVGNVFRYDDYGGGKQNEFTQAGIEVLGINTPESDAEVIAVAIQALKAAGLESFQVDIGQVEFFNGLMEETGLAEEDVTKVRTLIDRKDYVGLEEFLKRSEINGDLKKLISDLPGYFGSADVIEKVKSQLLNKRSRDALENIRQVLKILYDYGFGKYVSVDLGMLRGLSYDTGIIFRGFTYGAGFPILTGGRYDRLVGEFGMNCPATGFSLGVNMIMMALQRQKIEIEKPGIDSFICYRDTGRRTAFELCAELRKQGIVVEMDIANSSIEEAKDYALDRNIGGVISIIDEDTVEIHYIQSGEVASVKISELLKR